MNSKNIILIYPHQLFEQNEIIEDLLQKDQNLEVYLIEDFLFFRQYTFHKHKLILHRASMKFYENYLQNKYPTLKIIYIESSELHTRHDFFYIIQYEYKKDKIEKIYTYDVVDFYLEQDLKTFVVKNDIELIFYPSSSFINTKKDNDHYFKIESKGKKPIMKNFYLWQRKRLNILIDNVGKPIGGKFSFDTDNRKKLPKEYCEPKNLLFEETVYVLEAKEYVYKNFPNNYGDIDNFNYATDYKSSKLALNNFLVYKFTDFGIYEDSISSNFDFLNHSIISPYLNIGLLIPSTVVEEALNFSKIHPSKIPINSLEGFVRQIIGWREFIRAMYEIYGVNMRTKNFWNHKKRLSDQFWTAKTGNLVVDLTIQKILKNAYSHHIERLMIMGNYMLLSEFHPDDVYKWFMEMYIDSYDWVMVPNVYSMSQFADGGIFATKPYICASNYICNMSNYKKDGVWDKDFDEKFWSFLKKHKSFFSKNIRFKMLLNRIKD